MTIALLYHGEAGIEKPGLHKNWFNQKFPQQHYMASLYEEVKKYLYSFESLTPDKVV